MLSDPDLLSLKPCVIIQSPSSLLLLVGVRKMKQVVTLLYLTKLYRSWSVLHRFQQFLIREIEDTFFPWHSKPQPLKSVQYNFPDSARSGLSKKITLIRCCLFFLLGAVFEISFSKMHLKKIIDRQMYCNYDKDALIGYLLICTSNNTVHTAIFILSIAGLLLLLNAKKVVLISGNSYKAFCCHVLSSAVVSQKMLCAVQLTPAKVIYHIKHRHKTIRAQHFLQTKLK